MISVVKYELRQRASLNRMDLSSFREGLLVKANGGYGAIQPWPELGDPSLEKCLNDLKTGGENRLVQRALDSAAEMSTLYDSVRSPLLSHATLPRLTGTEAKASYDAGFRTFKVKRGKDWMRLRKKTAAFLEAYPCVRWRFDFNGALKSHLELHQFLGSLPAELIDFVEDPFSDPKLAATWRGVPIGYDRVIPEDLDLENGYLIVKPALQSLEEVSSLSKGSGGKVIFTSYMDHPVGQLSAYLQAQKFYEINSVENPQLSGLVTHGLYENTPYHELLGPADPELKVPNISELESILGKEKWITLNT